MLSLKNVNHGKYLSIGTLLNKVFEIGYQVYQDPRFDISLSYEPELDKRVSLSVNLFKFSVECNLHNSTEKKSLPEKKKFNSEKESDEKEFSETYSFPEEKINTDFDAQAAKHEIGKRSDELAKTVAHEIAEYGNLALHHWVGVEGGNSAPLNNDKSLAIGQSVIVRSLNGSTYLLDLHCDEDGWYVYHPATSNILDIFYDEKRKLWVMSEVIE